MKTLLVGLWWYMSTEEDLFSHFFVYVFFEFGWKSGHEPLRFSEMGFCDKLVA